MANFLNIWAATSISQRTLLFHGVR